MLALRASSTGLAMPTSTAELYRKLSSMVSTVASSMNGKHIFIGNSCQWLVRRKHSSMVSVQET